MFRKTSRRCVIAGIAVGQPGNGGGAPLPLLGRSQSLTLACRL